MDMEGNAEGVDSDLVLAGNAASDFAPPVSSELLAVDKAMETETEPVQNQEFKATLTPTGTVLYEGKESTLNAWCIGCMRTLHAEKASCCAWRNVKVNGRFLNLYRKEFSGAFEQEPAQRGARTTHGASSQRGYLMQDGTTEPELLEVLRKVIDGTAVSEGAPDARPPIDQCTEQQFMEDLVLFLVSKGNAEEKKEGKKLARELVDGRIILNGHSLDAFSLYRAVVAHGGFPPPRAQSPAGSAQGLEDAGAQSPAGSAQSLEDAGAQSPAGSAQGLEDAAPQLPAGSAQGLEDAGAQSPAGSPSVCRKHGDRPSCTVRGPSEVPQWLVEAYAAHRHIVQLSAELSQAKREKEQLAAQHQQERERAVKAEASQTKMAAEIAQHQQERERLLAAQHQQERERLLAAEGWSKMAGRNKELRAELSQAESEKDRLTTEMAGQVEQLTLELSSTKMNALQRLAETQAEQAQQHQVQLKEAHAVNTQMAASKDALLARARKAEAELVTLREGRTREQLAADGAAHGGDAEHGSTSKEGDILAVADEVDRIVYDPRNCPQATGSEPASRAREAIAQHLAPESCAAAMLQQLRQQSAPTPGSVEICHWPDHMVGGSVSPDVVRENCEELVKANERGTVPPSGCSLVRSGRSLAGTVVREKTVPENDTRLALR
eukprot:gene15774-18703_t